MILKVLATLVAVGCAYSMWSGHTAHINRSHIRPVSDIRAEEVHGVVGVIVGLAIVLSGLWL